jgi:hypothetical protein
MWEILCREPPFHKWKPHEIISKVVQQKARPDLSRVPQDCPKELVYVMQKCWEQHPASRPEFKDVVRVLKQLDEKGLII